MPVISYNIMLDNYWGQRVIEGARPIIHDNVTWHSPYYKEFREDGTPILYQPWPGNGEREANPKFIDPDGGNFRLAGDSPLMSFTSSTKTYGLVTGPGIQHPPVVPCKRSFAAEFDNRNEPSDSIISALRKQKAMVRSLSVSYTLEYKSYMNVRYDKYGDQASVEVTSEPVSGIRYDVPVWIMQDGKRRKTYTSKLFSAARSLSDTGTVLFDGEKTLVLSGRFKQHSTPNEDIYNVGEKTFRENVGGLYLDYDQYLNGSIGPIGTFFFGYLTVFGGDVSDKKVRVDGHDCVVITYPNIGSDQICKFYLDPEMGYCPLRLEHYFERELYRRIDGYSYERIKGIYLPISVTITDFAVKKPHIGKVVGTCTMKVKPSSIRLNEQLVWY
jgi:hypothetical protein